MKEETKVIEKDSQVNQQIKSLNGALDRLSVGVNNLEECIKPVLSEIPPDKTGEEDDIYLVPLAVTIRNLSRNANRAADQVYSILDRLEL